MSTAVQVRAYRRSERGAWHYAPAAADTGMPFAGETLCGRPIAAAEVTHAVDVGELEPSQRLELCRECRLAAGESWLPS